MEENKSKPVNCGCGGEARIRYGETSESYWVECSKCRISTLWGMRYSEEEAVESWNKAMGCRKPDKILFDALHTKNNLNCANCKHWNDEDGDCEEICKLCGSLDYCSWWEEA